MRDLGRMVCLFSGLGFGSYLAVWSILNGYSIGAGLAGLMIVVGIWGYIEGGRS